MLLSLPPLGVGSRWCGSASISKSLGSGRGIPEISPEGCPQGKEWVSMRFINGQSSGLHRG